MYKKVVLDNGVRLVSEKIPYVRSVAIGIWVGTGSRNETIENNGISHFIEHMMFKGTGKRSAKEIAESIDNIGGVLNAFTSKECTCYYTKVLDTHIETAVDILADMFFNSRFDEKNIDVEKKVISEEIDMYEDSPEELVHDVLSEVVWEGNPLGFPILGTDRSLSNFSRETIFQYMKDNYTPNNTVISVAGNFDEEKLQKTVNRYFGNWKVSGKENIKPSTANFVSGSKEKEKDTEQVHICFGFKGIEHGNDELYTLLAINNVFGGGMSSRLFQKIREENGLVYSIYSYPSSYSNAGLFTIYAGMNPEQLPVVANMICDEIKILLKNGICSDELEKSKEQLKGSYILGLESTSSRMNSIGKSELLLGYIRTQDEILDKINKINMQNVSEVISKVFDLKRIGFAAVGNIRKNIRSENLADL
jgi:predicted Zn-dependent peptidase